MHICVVPSKGDMTALLSFNTVGKKRRLLPLLSLFPLKSQISICVKITTDLLEGRGSSLFCPQCCLLKVLHTQLYIRSVIFNFKRSIQII